MYNTRIGYVSDMFWPMGIHYYTSTIRFWLTDLIRIHGLPFWEPLVLAVTSGLDVSLNQRVKYRVWVRVLTEGVPQVRLLHSVSKTRVFGGEGVPRRYVGGSVARGSLRGEYTGGLVVGVPPTRIVLSVDTLTRAGLV